MSPSAACRSNCTDRGRRPPLGEPLPSRRWMKFRPMMPFITFTTLPRTARCLPGKAPCAGRRLGHRPVFGSFFTSIFPRSRWRAAPPRPSSRRRREGSPAGAAAAAAGPQARRHPVPSFRLRGGVGRRPLTRSGAGADATNRVPLLHRRLRHRRPLVAARRLQIHVGVARRIVSMTVPAAFDARSGISAAGAAAALQEGAPVEPRNRRGRPGPPRGCSSELGRRRGGGGVLLGARTRMSMARQGSRRTNGGH